MMTQRQFHAAFISGCLLTLATISLYQDCLGQEGYIDHIKEHWVDPSITTPLAIVFLVVAFLLTLYTAKED